jgi:transposase-like protein
MPAPLAPAKRAAILQDIRAGGKSRNDIARAHGVAASTVGKIAADEGVTDAFDRTHSLKGARAKAVDNRAKRAQLESDLLDDAQKIRKRAWSPYTVVVSGPEGAETVTLELPPLQDVRAAYTSIGIIVDKSVVIEKHDSGDDAEAAKSVLAAVMEGLTARHGDGA